MLRLGFEGSESETCVSGEETSIAVKGENDCKGNVITQ